MRPLALARAAVYNDAEGRPRAPVRLVGHTLLLAVWAVALVALAAAVTGPAALRSLSPPGVLAANALLLGAAAVAATLVAVHVLDHRPLADAGMGVDGAWWRDLVAGCALGAALQTGILLTSVAAGWTTVAGVGGPGVLAGMALGAVLMVAVGFYEELWFRGYYLTNVAEGLTALPGVDARRAAVAAAALTAAAFGGVHAANPDAGAVSTALVAGYGCYLAAGYLLTGDLGLPVGFHAAWNYVQGFVYGFPVSGVDVPSLLATRTAGPTALTGGGFGPEAGLLGAGWALASLPALAWWVRRTRGKLRLQAGIAAFDGGCGGSAPADDEPTPADDP